MDTRQTVRNRPTDMECETEIIRERYATRGEPGPRVHRGTPYPGEVTRQQQIVAGFKHMVEKANALWLSQRESVSPPWHKMPSSDSGQSTPASATRPTLQGRRRLPALPSTKPWSKPDNTDAYEAGMGTGESPTTSPTPSAHRKTSPALQPASAANDTARKLEPYLASIDNTLKGLGPHLAQVNVLAPYLEQVNRILKRLEQRLAPVVPQLPQPRALPTPVTVNKQGTIIKYLVRQSEISTDREARAQPTPPLTAPRGALGSDGSNTPPSDVATSRGQSPETVDWRGALEGCQVNWGATSEAEEPSARPT